MPETLAILFLAHVLADYVVQPAWMVEDKAKPETLFLHFLAIVFTAMLCTGQLASPAVYALALVHIVIDAVKVRCFSDSFIPHVTDQALHLVTLAATALLCPDLFATGLYGDVTWLPKLMLLGAGAIYATRAGGIAINKLLATFDPQPTSKGYPQSGPLIGNLERALTYLCIMAQMPEGIGFLLAAKVVMRFQTGTTDEKRYEYVFIGTLASFGWAIAVTLAVMFMASLLPPVGISLPNH